jgi:hypothetical protein
MKYIRVVLIALQLVAWSGSAAGFLHTQGQDIVDESGTKVMLRGVGLGNWLLPEGYMWRFGGEADRPRRIEKLVADLIGPEEGAVFWREYRRNYVTEADIERIAQLGFNSVRPALDARLFLTEGDAPQEVKEGFDLLDHLVSWASRHGVYVIIDMHAAPGGQTGQNIDDSADDEPRLFMDKQNQDRLADLWVKIARRYANEPAVAAYDLLNEPLPQRTGAEGKFKAQLQPLYERITRAIREVDQKHMITVEGADWANDWSAFTPPAFDKNLVYQFHYYCWDQPAKLKGIDQYLAFRDQVNAPVWVGETGEANDAIYWATTEYFESKNIGWSFWPWKKMQARNAPYSIKAPADWDEITAYSRGGPKPSPETARRAFAELLGNIKLDNCRFSPDVVNSILRRAPVRIEAENYGQDGLNESYFVRHPAPHAKLYRVSEPVAIESSGATEGRWRNGQAIQLTAGEWTAYTINSPAAADYNLTVRARSERDSASSLQVAVNEAAQDATFTNSAWTDYKLNPTRLGPGPNRIKLLVKTGAAGIDWLEVQATDPGRQ